MEFKEKLLIVRKSLGLSQTEMAQRLGASFTTINRIEKGRQKPSSETISKLDLLFVELFGDDDESAFRRLLLSPSHRLNDDLTIIIEPSKERVIHAINIALLQRNYLIGKRINEELLINRAKDYGQAIIQNLSRFLTEKYGDGFEASTLYLCVRFFHAFPNIFLAAHQTAV